MPSIMPILNVVLMSDTGTRALGTLVSKTATVNLKPDHRAQSNSTQLAIGYKSNHSTASAMITVIIENN